MGKILDWFKKEEDFRLKNSEEVLKELSESMDYYCNILTSFTLSSKELTTVKEKGWKLVSFAYIPFEGFSNYRYYIFERVEGD